MATGAPLAIPANSMPAGGMAAQQPAGPVLTPADISAIVESIPLPVIVAFREASSPLSVLLTSQTAPAGGVLGYSNPIQIANVGLGYRVMTEHTAVFTIANATGSAQSASFGYHFPYNLIAATQVQINGGAQSYNTDGANGLFVAFRDRKNMLAKKSLFGTGDRGGVPDPMLRFSGVGSNLTLGSSQLSAYASGGIAPLCGYSTISAAASASTNNTFTLTWYTLEKLAFSKDSLLGSLPLQNNTTNAQLNRQLASALVPGTTNAATGSRFPFWNVSANLTITWTGYSNKSAYKFWSVPDNPQLYSDMISNSYQVLTQPSIPLATTGQAALAFTIPNNTYLSALHVALYDSTDALVNPLSTFTADRLEYNAQSVTPVQELEGIKQFEAYTDYGTPMTQLAGYFLWDGNATSDDIVNTDQAGWLDTYRTASPQLQVDIASGFSATGGYALTREVVVSGATAVVGGQG